MPQRSYRQNCALALALDRVGERWTLLLIRELLTGPKRYKDLLANLPGIGTNLLATRLKQLEAEGVVRRVTLPPPAGTPAYKLTEQGRELEPAVVELVRWGLRYLGPWRKNILYRPGWSVLALKATFHPERARGVGETYEFDVEGEVFHVRVEDGRIETRQGPAWKPDLVLRTDARTFLRLALGEVTAEAAIRSGSLRVEGGPKTLKRAGEILGVHVGRRRRSGRK
jgi:DNA-binding HxlR family transcriptional regulator/putative sterol carrier protein